MNETITTISEVQEEQQEKYKKRFYAFDGRISRDCEVTIKIIEDKLKKPSYDEELAFECAKKAIDTIWNTPELNEPNPHGFIWFDGYKHDYPTLLKREKEKRIYKIYLSKIYQVKFCVYKREIEALEKLKAWVKNTKWIMFPLVVQARELWHSEIIHFQPLENDVQIYCP